jgi:hypothetical protein
MAPVLAMTVTCRMVEPVRKRALGSVALAKGISRRGGGPA